MSNLGHCEFCNPQPPLFFPLRPPIVILQLPPILFHFLSGNIFQLLQPLLCQILILLVPSSIAIGHLRFNLGHLIRISLPPSTSSPSLSLSPFSPPWSFSLSSNKSTVHQGIFLLLPLQRPSFKSPEKHNSFGNI